VTGNGPELIHPADARAGLGHGRFLIHLADVSRVRTRHRSR
jgi:hypothetical protein